MLKKVLLILAGTAFITPQVSAQGIRLGPQLGFHKSTDADKGNYMVGAAMRLRLSPVLGVEGSINYRQEKFANDELTVRSWPVMATAILCPFPIAYGAFGAGWYNTTFDFNSELVENETNQEFGWHLGGGVELPVGANAKLTGDIRYVFLNYDFNAVPFDELDSNFFVISAGLLLGL